MEEVCRRGEVGESPVPRFAIIVVWTPPPSPPALLGLRGLFSIVYTFDHSP
jgi:hypothetical protein